METLGFFDPPSITTSSFHSPIAVPRASTAAQTRPTNQSVEELWESTQLPAETLIDWKPTATSRRLHGRNIRWGILLMVTLVVGAMAAAAYWLYERSASTGTLAASVVAERAQDLDFSLSQLTPAAGSLATGEDLASEDMMTKILAVNEAARDLFAASADLSSSQSQARSIAADAATLSLDATQRVNDISAYRDAFAPILLPPALETDSSLVDLSVAVQDFSDWRTRIARAREALPSDVATQTTERFDQFLGSLELMQREYLDALRSEARFDAGQVVADIDDELVSIRSLLDADISDAGERAWDQIEDARAKLGLLVG